MTDDHAPPNPDHQEKADQLEKEASDLERESEHLHGHIDETRDDWERKKADPLVPGAAGDPAGDSDVPPEVTQPG
jgi:hypothetical protein